MASLDLPCVTCVSLFALLNFPSPPRAQETNANPIWHLPLPSPMMIASRCGRKPDRPPEPAVGAFGEKLRKQREQRGIELDAISNTTKISTRMLRALEDERFDQLPGGVFNKGFVRAYARLVGLDEEEAIADYLAALRESQIQAQSILPDFRSPAGKPDTVAVREAPNSTIRREVPPGNNGTDD